MKNISERSYKLEDWEVSRQTKLSEHITDEEYQREVLQVRRLGSKQANETETHETRTRIKALLMKNLYKLKNKGKPFRTQKLRLEPKLTFNSIQVAAPALRLHVLSACTYRKPCPLPSFCVLGTCEAIATPMGHLNS